MIDLQGVYFLALSVGDRIRLVVCSSWVKSPDYACRSVLSSAGLVVNGVVPGCTARYETAIAIDHRLLVKTQPLPESEF